LLFLNCFQCSKSIFYCRNGNQSCGSDLPAANASNIVSAARRITVGDTLTLGTPLTASTVTLNGGRLVGGNNLVPSTLNYFGGLISPAPSTANDVQISPAANGQFLLLPSSITNELFIQDGLVNITIENDVITGNLDFGNETLLNMAEPRVLTVLTLFAHNHRRRTASRLAPDLHRCFYQRGRETGVGNCN
jgi:hypothetical protein